MEIPTALVNLLASQDTVYKIFLLIFMVLYAIFAVILYIQIRALVKVVNQINFSPIFVFLAFVNIVASVLIIGYTILSLTL